MTELDGALVRRKLAVLARNLSDLESVRDLSPAEYREDRFRRKAVERMLQEAIDAAVDANLHLVLEAVGRAIRDFGAYVQAVEAHLEREGV